MFNGRSGRAECEIGLAAFQRLGDDDAARPVGAVDHHQCLRVRHGRVEPVDEFGTRQVDRARDAEVTTFRLRPAVEDDDILLNWRAGWNIVTGH